MSSSPDEKALGRDHRRVGASEIEALADKLVALVDEFDATISHGRIPPAFAERLTELRRTAEQLIDG